MILASPYTQLFWNEYQINPDRYDYNIVFDNTISGLLDINKLSSCLSRMLNDYVLLNSHLCFDQGDLYWKKHDVIIPLTGIENHPKTIAEFISKPFHLEKGPLYRFGIVSLDKGRHRFILVLHHALIDGNHFDEFLTLLSTYYNNPSLSKQENEQALSALHQKQHDEVNYLKKVGSSTVWSHYLSGTEAKNNLPYIKSQYSGMGIIEFSIPAKTISTLKAVFSTSPFNLLLLAWGILISKYCSTNTSCISYPIKITTGCDNLFGAQININVAKIAFQGTDSFHEVVAYYQQALQLLITPNHKHTYLPIGDIVNSTDIQKLNVGFAQTHLRKSTFTFKDCHAVALEDNYIDMGGYDIVLEYQALENNYCFRLKYNSALFSVKQMKALPNHYKQFIQTLISSPNQPIKDISLPTKSEYHKIVYNWNKTDKPYPKDKTVYQLFEEQVAKTPNNIAVVFEHNKLTYAQLNSRANQLANYLRQQVEIKPDMFIGLFLDKSLEMIIGILGILKAGGAYVPLDPSYPEARVSYILEDTQTPVILTHSHYIQNLSCLTTCLCIAIDKDCYQQASKENLTPLSKSNNLAYVIYTSGVTPHLICQN